MCVNLQANNGLVRGDNIRHSNTIFKSKMFEESRKNDFLKNRYGKKRSGLRFTRNKWIDVFGKGYQVYESTRHSKTIDAISSDCGFTFIKLLRSRFCPIVY